MLQKYSVLLNLQVNNVRNQPEGSIDVRGQQFQGRHRQRSVSVEPRDADHRLSARSHGREERARVALCSQKSLGEDKRAFAGHFLPVKPEMISPQGAAVSRREAGPV